LKAVTLNSQDVTDTGVDFKANDAENGLEIVLTDRSAVVNGTVVKADRAAVSGSSVVVYAADGSRWGQHSRFVQMVRTDQAGRFQVRGLPPENYLAIAVTSSPRTEWNDPEFLERARPHATKFSLREGQTTTLTLTARTAP
jgi:hypothetical protein